MKKLMKHRLSNAAKKPPALVFSIPLATSLDYAGAPVTLALTRPGASSDVTVPVVVAKCASRLRAVGLDSEGIFRKPGAARRIAELQEVFDDPGRDYGAAFDGSDWEPYTAEDVADLLRRYLTRLPEPVVPPSFYQRFVQAVPDSAPGSRSSSSSSSSPSPSSPSSATPAAIAVTPEQADAYAALINALPTPNRHLLLYLLDLLAAFAARAEATRMPASSLAAVFHPSVLALSGDGEGLDALKHKQGQDVLERLISLYSEIVQRI